MVRGVQIKPLLVSVGILAGIAAVVTLAAQATTQQDGVIYWSDGDSGRLPDGTRFRLHGVDAPETGSLLQRGGAECEAEREIGYLAKEAAVELTRGKTITITRDYGPDRYKRLVIDLAIDGEDLAGRLIAAGTHKVWDYDGGAPKPDWCARPAQPGNGDPLTP